MKLICKQCKQEFEITDSEINFFKSKNLNIPKRCKRCRAVNKSKNNISQLNNSYDHDFYYENTNKKNSFFKALIIFSVIIICALAIFFSFVHPRKANISKSPISSGQQVTYYLNTYRHKFHRPSCPSVLEMNSQNRQEFYGTREEAIEMGYSPCHNCNP